MLFKTIIESIVLIFFLFLISTSLQAQQEQLNRSQQFRLAERIIRIAEPGQLADSINVWGDIGSSGRYLIPRGTSLIELLSYGFGPNTINDSQTRLDWSKLRVEVYVNEFNDEKTKNNITKFTYRFEEPIPVEMANFPLNNNQTITLRVKRKPGFRDYVGIIAPVISAIATSFLALSRAREL